MNRIGRDTALGVLLKAMNRFRNQNISPYFDVTKSLDADPKRGGEFARPCRPHFLLALSRPDQLTA